MKKQFAIMWFVYVILASVLAVTGSYAASLRTSAMTQVQVKAFPDLKYMELMKDLDRRYANIILP